MQCCTSETSVDTAVYHVAPKGSISVQGGSSDQTIYFTYANAGYLNAKSSATLLTITDTNITFTKYTNSDAENQGTVTRIVTEAAPTLESIKISGTTSYTVGETLDLKVTATYSDDTTKDVTKDAELTGYDMNSVGTQIVTATYGEKSATIEIIVSESTDDSESTENESTESNTTVDTIPGTAEVPGNTVSSSKDVWKLTDTLTNNGTYLIVNTNVAGAGYALINNNGSINAVGITVVNDGTNTYIELDNSGAAWTATGSDSSWAFENSSNYLGWASEDGSGIWGSYSTTNTLTLSSSAQNWTIGTNELYTNLKTGAFWGGAQYDDFYLTGGSSWSIGTDSANVYFYTPATITSTTGTQDATYGINITVDGTAATTYDVKAGKGITVQLGTAFTSTVDGQTPSGGSYTWEVVSNDSVATVDSDGLVTLTGTEGEETIKVTYTWTENDTEYLVYNYITINALSAVYALDLVDGTTKKSITDPIVIKGVTSDTTASVWAVITADGEDIGDVDDDAIEWTSSDESIATVDPATGVISFTGTEGIVYITASYEYTTGNSVTDTVKFSVTATHYSVPADGTSDFPEYPNEGAIRYDKTATAVGNFSETGIAQVELSMTGVPYTTGNEMDVVVMLDMSTSMDDTRIAATVAATKVFINSIVKNEDGSYNSNRIYVGYFNGDTVYTITDSDNIGGELASVDSDTEYNALITDIVNEYDGSKTTSGTNYDVSLEKCYTVLNTAKTDGVGNDRSQFVVFMSDGGPTDYAISESGVISESTIVNYFEVGEAGSTATDPDEYTNTVPTEYWSNLMKNNGVTIYSVGLILQEQPDNGPQTYRSYTDNQYYYITKTLLTGISSGEDYFFNCESSSDTDEMEDIFSSIAQKILEAATNVVVTDKIADEYTMIFDIPTGNKTIVGLENQEFYIEVKEYTLDSNHERTSTYTSLAKVYLAVDEETGAYYAASDVDGTEYADPVFTKVSDGEKGYYSIVKSDYTAAAGEIVLNVDDTYYKFIEDGTGGYNMTSGAYAYGTIDSTTNMSNDLVIVTPYFCYSAAIRMLAWTAEKLSTTELALSYFLYLNNSATEVGTDNETESGPYPTNDWAYITYTNFNGNECRQEFPVPQLTWNGAQVSYVFYLVNAAGQPINKSGQVVDFANATFVTDVFTEHVVWNKEGTVGETELNVNYLADELLPDAYTIYDESAKYTIHVYRDADGEKIFDYFIISGSAEETINTVSGTTVASDDTTKVYNTKAGTKYSEYGIYSAEAIGANFTTKDADGNNVTIITTKQASLDYSDTTVAFAVLWEPKLVEDTVVVDYGLDVVVNVVQNDYLQNTVNGIGLGKDAYGNTAMNTGVSTASKLGTAALTTSDGSTISIENENSIRFHQSDMTFEEPVTFYYESPVEFYEGSNKQEGYMYSSVTVIPATTIYYEDSFVDLSIWNTDDEKLDQKWEIVGSNTTATQDQDQDRPGESQISTTLDADNNYGYDSAYKECSQYSLGSARKVTVDSGKYAEAQFTFYGTGFDVISLTSNTTGTISVDVYDADDFDSKAYGATPQKTEMVDTYYGYKQDTDGNWVVDEESTDTLYQVPVMKVSDLDYGRYTVVITIAYYSGFDHKEKNSLDFYLDAIRVYDPTGNENETANEAYLKDGEAYPIYKELRNLVIDSGSFGSNVTVNSDDYSATTEVNGVVFIDGDSKVNNAQIIDYTNYGPNNELYLAPGQAIAFQINDVFIDADSNRISPVDVQLGIKNVGGSANVEIFNPGIKVTTTTGETTTTTTTAATKDNLVSKTINTATDMYYSIKELADGTIVISNPDTSSGSISITNLKFTFEKAATIKKVTSVDEETGEEETNEASVASISEEGAVFSLRSLSAYSVSETVEIVPEIFEPETFEVSINKTSVKVGQKVKVTVTTSEDVAYITVNGETVDNYRTNKKTGLRTWTMQLNAAEAGEMAIEVVAFNDENVASESIVKQVTVNTKNSGKKK